ncbi:snare associated Golgi protein-domain-containing protein [Russula earlei]|uniref:Snare associated Golgi protein-domain-containing protein n=1 Tax=Russula earlei TaxID=71964 RepID=A0ACC0U0Z3_9AGAM|nr:snare associated Golgi protein-domain-containing protein [Russula earlei]
MSSPYLAYGNPQFHVGPTPYVYPPNNALSEYSLPDSMATVPGKHEFAPYPSRTPSPTPSEAATLARDSVLDWKRLCHWRFWLRREWLWYYVFAIVLAVITALITIYHHQIVEKLTPAAHWVKSLPGGWSIPIVILFIISFPPLFGHEIIAILCGIVWGLWIGFAIVAAGTFIGELGNFYAFKYCCRARGEKLERTNIQYACLARVVREGGFRIALIARLSAIPGHFTTAVFSSCGMDVWTFALAAFLSLPKQFATVYIGVIIEGAGKIHDPSDETTPQRVASYSLIAVTTIITFIALWYIYRELNRVKPSVIYDRRKARQAKIELTRSFYDNDVSRLSTFKPNESESNIPLGPYDSERDPDSEFTHQQWDERGHAVGYPPDPRLHAPIPRPPSFGPSALYESSDVAVAVPSSQDLEDEWSNAHTPQTARPPDVAAPASRPPSGPPHRVEDKATSPASSLPSPQQSPLSGRTHSPPSTTTAQYVTYYSDHFASPSIEAGSGATHRQDKHYSSPSPLTGARSVPSGASSPPPRYG